MQFHISDSEFQSIMAALPPPYGSDPEIVNRLKYIFEDWCQIDLPEHRFATEKSALLPETLKRLENVSDSAKAMIAALDAAKDEGDQDFVEFEIIKARGKITVRAEWEAAAAEISAMRKTLVAVEAAAADSLAKLRPRKGRPMNAFGYLLLLDLAAIFEWVTGKKATRRVDRMTHEETGPFYEFARIVWPMVTSNGSDGFIAAWRNWADFSRKYRERSPIIANFKLRCRAYDR